MNRRARLSQDTCQFVGIRLKESSICWSKRVICRAYQSGVECGRQSLCAPGNYRVGRSIHWEQWMPLKGFSAHEIDDKHLPSNLESQSRRSRQQRP